MTANGEPLALAVGCLTVGAAVIYVPDRGLLNVLIAAALAVIDWALRLQARRAVKAAPNMERIRNLSQAERAGNFSDSGTNGRVCGSEVDFDRPAGEATK